MRAAVSIRILEDYRRWCDSEELQMWRSFFLAMGISLCILGVECLFIDEAVLAKSIAAPANAVTADGALVPGGGQRRIRTQEWMPWSFLGTGAVIILYTITIPRRFTG
jgi:hypothetical protein